MEGETFTYTARSSNNPEKMVTFTLNNGDVSMQLGNALLEYLENANDAQQTADGVALGDWAKPMALGVLQKISHPLPINDFQAGIDDAAFKAIVWLRSGGLRLAPIVMSWEAVDNPAAARAFVEEVNRRQQTAAAPNTLPGLLDYWLSWLAAGASLIVFIVMVSRLLGRSDNEE